MRAKEDNTGLDIYIGIVAARQPVRPAAREQAF